jgi:hypothetical protein
LNNNLSSQLEDISLAESNNQPEIPHLGNLGQIHRLRTQAEYLLTSDRTNQREDGSIMSRRDATTSESILQ